MADANSEIWTELVKMSQSDVKKRLNHEPITAEAVVFRELMVFRTSWWSVCLQLWSRVWLSHRLEQTPKLRPHSNYCNIQTPPWLHPQSIYCSICLISFSSPRGHAPAGLAHICPTHPAHLLYSMPGKSTWNTKKTQRLPIRHIFPLIHSQER